MSMSTHRSEHKVVILPAGRAISDLEQVLAVCVSVAKMQSKPKRTGRQCKANLEAYSAG